MVNRPGDSIGCGSAVWNNRVPLSLRLLTPSVHRHLSHRLQSLHRLKSHLRHVKFCLPRLNRSLFHLLLPLVDVKQLLNAILEHVVLDLVSKCAPVELLNCPLHNRRHVFLGVSNNLSRRQDIRLVSHDNVMSSDVVNIRFDWPR